MDIERARFNMVEQQIRTWEVLDPGVLDLLYVVRREEFVPPMHRLLAFSDLELPLTAGGDPCEKMLPPKVEARILQEVAPKPADRVLEVGTGSGYMAALLASRASEVVSVEINPLLKGIAETNLRRAGILNVRLALGDGARGWADARGFDVIVLGGSVPILPGELLNGLVEGGRLFAVVGEAPVMSARLVTRLAGNLFNAIDLFETVLAPLRNAREPARFSF
ncbi:MAG: protein-L-isoaspartate O-methyltransferase family protein [Burkholderiales bacterium]